MTATAPIPNLKLIRLIGQVNISDDPSLPFKLYVNCRPPAFMDVAFIMMHGGSEELIVRSKTRGAIDKFVALNKLREHPRLRWGHITGPDMDERFEPAPRQQYAPRDADGEPGNVSE